MSIKGETLIKQLQWRYAVKFFDPQKKIPEETISQILQSLILTPSSYGMQPWKFFIINDETKKKELRKISYDQAQITDCSHLIVLAAKTKITQKEIDEWIKQISQIQQKPLSKLESYREMITQSIGKMPQEKQHQWAKNQVYIALGQLLCTLSMLKIDACPMEGISIQEYDKYLHLPEGNLQTAVACTLGYRSPQDKAAQNLKTRFPAKKIIKYIQ